MRRSRPLDDAGRLQGRARRRDRRRVCKRLFAHLATTPSRLPGRWASVLLQQRHRGRGTRVEEIDRVAILDWTSTDATGRRSSHYERDDALHRVAACHGAWSDAHLQIGAPEELERRGHRFGRQRRVRRAPATAATSAPSTRSSRSQRQLRPGPRARRLRPGRTSSIRTEAARRVHGGFRQLGESFGRLAERHLAAG